MLERGSHDGEDRPVGIDVLLRTKFERDKVKVVIRPCNVIFVQLLLVFGHVLKPPFGRKFSLGREGCLYCIDYSKEFGVFNIGPIQIRNLWCEGDACPSYPFLSLLHPPSLASRAYCFSTVKSDWKVNFVKVSHNTNRWVVFPFCT